MKILLLLIIASSLNASVISLGQLGDGSSVAPGSVDDPEISLETLIAQSLSFDQGNVVLNPAGNLIGQIYGDGYTLWTPLAPLVNPFAYVPVPPSEIVTGPTIPPVVPSPPVYETPEPRWVVVLVFAGLLWFSRRPGVSPRAERS